jgi:ribosomal subunit interface protein
MLQKLEIQGVHTTLDPRLRRYVMRKIGGLDRYLPRHARESAHAEVHLKEAKIKRDNGSACEVTLFLPHETIVIKERALNMYAAVDIVEAKLKQQLKKYKDLHMSGKLHRRLMARFTRKQGRGSSL